MIPKTVIVRGEEYKCRVFKIHLKLRDQQLKVIKRSVKLKGGSLKR